MDNLEDRNFFWEDKREELTQNELPHLIPLIEEIISEVNVSGSGQT